MQFTTLILAVSIMTAPVQSSSLRSLVGDKQSSNKSGEESDTAMAIIDGESDQGERELLSSWCAVDTPPLWHPDYDTAWSAAGCIFVADCDSPGYATNEECCKGSYGGQTSGACAGGGSAPTTVQWYADYGTAWPNAGCKSEWPYPIYATTFFETQAACCKGAYAGQTSNACIGGLPSPPTFSPTTLAAATSKWYADYSTAWPNAGCKNTLPLPIYTIVTYTTQLACCKGAYSGQPTDACLQKMPNPPTKKPTAAPTSKPTSKPTLAPTSKPTSTPTLAPTSKPTLAPTSKPTSTPTAAPTLCTTASGSTATPSCPCASGGAVSGTCA